MAGGKGSSPYDLAVYGGTKPSNSFQERTELGDNEENQEKAVPVKDKENNQIRKESLELASPS